MNISIYQYQYILTNPYFNDPDARFDLIACNVPLFTGTDCKLGLEDVAMFNSLKISK